MASKETGPRALVGVLAALLLLSIGLFSPSAGAAKRKPRTERYSISLTTSVQAASTETREGATPPFGCKGRNIETFSYSASGHSGPTANRVPLRKHGPFRYFDFPGQLTGVSASLTEDITPRWEFDPTVPFGPEDPSVCAFPGPTHTVGHCKINPEQDGFNLLPFPGDGGRFTLTYEASAIVLDCPPVVEYPLPGGFFSPIVTSLHVGSVLALRKHKSVSASGSVSRPLTGALTPDTIGKETVGYTLKVTRVR
jgi:hypothetical protein